MKRKKVFKWLKEVEEDARKEGLALGRQRGFRLGVNDTKFRYAREIREGRKLLCTHVIGDEVCDPCKFEPNEPSCGCTEEERQVCDVCQYARYGEGGADDPDPFGNYAKEEGCNVSK